MTTNTDLAASLTTLLRQHGGAWQGTITALLTLLPGTAADATRLARRLTDAADALAAAGVQIERRRQAGTGRRVMVLRLGDAPHLTAMALNAGDGVTLAGGQLVSTMNNEGGERVTLGASLGAAIRRAQAQRA
jgi:hypothetical protein